MKYCRYCGKIIDDDSSFCTHCGKNQDAQAGGSNASRAFSRFKESITDFVKKACSVIKRPKSNTGSTEKTELKKWAKRISLAILTLIVGGLMGLLGFWLYGFYQTSRWSKSDERREAIATKDINKADSIARVLFKEYANKSHQYNFNESKCDFDHLERGIEIIRYAAEKGNAKAQATLGALYAGARYDTKDADWGTYTMMGTAIDYQRAAYWYNQAAIQGVPWAMNNLAQLYKNGNGVEKDLFKAAQLTISAAEKGSALAQLNLGDMYRDREVWLMTEDPDGGVYYYAIPQEPMIDEAKKWWTKALENEKAKEEIKVKAKERLERMYE